MSNNKYWVQKADLVVSDFVSSGGYLNAEQTQALFEIPIKESVVLQLATFKAMKSNSLEISKLGFTGRVLRGAVENQALTVGERSAPGAGKTTLTATEFIAEVRVPYGALEDHVTQGTLMTHIRNLLGKAIARDIEFVALQGDTTVTVTDVETRLQSKKDGFIKQATTNTVAAGSVRLDKSVLKEMRQTLGDQFKRRARQMAYLTSDNASIDYGDSLASRMTSLGDAKMMDLTSLEYAGSPVIGVPEFPNALGTGTDETVVLFCDPKNMHVGMQRDVSIETDKDISARQYIVVATLRFDVKWAHEPAVVKATAVKSDAAP
jgi:hypothetical protein